MTTANKGTLSEEMVAGCGARSCRIKRATVGVQGPCSCLEHVPKWAAKVSALERKVEAGIVGLVPEGLTIYGLSIENHPMVGNRYRVRLIGSHVWKDREGTGPTPELAVLDAVSRIKEQGK